MPAEPPAAAAPASRDGRDAGYDDGERFVFGAEPVRERWLGRPLAETRGWLELARLLADPVLYGVGVPHGDGSPVVLMPGFLARRPDARCHRDLVAAAGLPAAAQRVRRQCRMF
jgi:hypothetical protein